MPVPAAPAPQVPIQAHNPTIRAHIHHAEGGTSVNSNGVAASHGSPKFCIPNKTLRMCVAERAKMCEERQNKHHQDEHHRQTFVGVTLQSAPRRAPTALLRATAPATLLPLPPVPTQQRGALQPTGRERRRQRSLSHGPPTAAWLRSGVSRTQASPCGECKCADINYLCSPHQVIAPALCRLIIAPALCCHIISPALCCLITCTALCTVLPHHLSCTVRPHHAHCTSMQTPSRLTSPTLGAKRNAYHSTHTAPSHPLAGRSRHPLV